MKILHTSDWHFGKNIENVSRMEEQTAFSKELCSVALDNNVDAVIVAGDVFDTVNPPLWTEKLYYDTLKNLADAGIPSIVISGNHDSPQGLCSAKSLAGSNGIIICEYPYTVVEKGNYGNLVTVNESGAGWFEITTAKGKKAVIAALSYPSESRIAQTVDYSEGESNIKKDYNERLKLLINDLASHFKKDHANIFVSHIYVNGGKTSDSERNFQLGGAYAVNGDTLPCNCDYIALGHLHRPQKVSGTDCPAYYSGSPIAYSFSEEGYSKSVYVVDITDHNADVKTVELSCGKSMVTARLNGIEEAVRWCEQHSGADIWASIEIVSDCPITSEQLKTMKNLCPGLVTVSPVIMTNEEAVISSDKRLSKPIEETFEDFYKLKCGKEMPENIRKAFADLRGDI